MPPKKKSVARELLTPRASPTPTLPDAPSDVEPEEAAGPSKKRARPSKRDIPDYHFTEEQVQDFVEFVRQHPALYDKRTKEWSNPRYKEDLWRELAGLFPDCTYQQCRKYFDKKRTDFGKIEKRESRSGGPLRERTPREEEVMRTWSFLRGHIAHEPTQASETFDPAPSPPPRRPPHDSGDDDSGQSGLSAHSLERRRRMQEERRRSTPTASPERRRTTPTINVSPSRQEEQTLAGHAIQELLQKADTLTKRTPMNSREGEVLRFLEYLGAKLMKVSPLHLATVTSKILEMATAFEEPPADAVSQIKDVPGILARFSGSSTAAPAPPPQQMWIPQPMAPPPPPTAMQQPQYQQPQYQQQQFQQQQYQQQQYQQQQYLQPAPAPTAATLQPTPPRQQQQQQTHPAAPFQLPWSPSWPQSPMPPVSPLKSVIARAIAEVPSPRSRRSSAGTSIQTPRGPDDPESDHDEDN